MRDITIRRTLAETLYIQLRREGACVSVAAAFASSRWNVRGGCLVAAEERYQASIMELYLV